MDSLGDFTTSRRVVPISLAAIGIGVLGALVALALLRLIGLFTNLFFFQRWGFELVPSAGSHLGAWVIPVPVVGGLVVGFIARYGSERIRGHGIPEALEAILVKGSRLEPRVAFWKPIASAVAIGSGGPFGAEGPIIMTGGAFGSIVAQLMSLTSLERRTLLVAGAAAGMSATFAAPVSAVILAVELLLFEWMPRSVIPVAMASATAAVVRHYLLGAGPIFPVPPHAAFVGLAGALGCVAVGLSAGALSMLLTWAVYAAEDAFERLPMHWMWWPALGGLAVGLGGWLFPRALGVGYDVIAEVLRGGAAPRFLLGLLAVKGAIWALALGSGTSGGVLAPLLMMGGALGGLEAHFLPAEGAGFWALIGMAAILAGTVRSPFTSIVFALELTHDVTSLLPLLIACFVAHAITVLYLRRDILTQKVSRHGFHLSREYAVDPLETVFVGEIMRVKVAVLPELVPAERLPRFLKLGRQGGQRLYPVLDGSELILGVITRDDLERISRTHAHSREDLPLAAFLSASLVTAYPDEPMRAVVLRMMETGMTRLPVVSRLNPRRLEGLVSLKDILKARLRRLDDERRRRRVLSVRRIFSIS
ncbi:MAG TPA: chloride channel protein [Elusimicrobiota bacterium]|nr:chloride channel protein [Elusimicrobiota bacterium]